MIGMLYDRVPKVCIPQILMKVTFFESKSSFMLVRTIKNGFSRRDDEYEVADAGI